MEEATEVHPQAWIFFVSYVLLASFLVINILIAIIINSIEEARRDERGVRAHGRRAPGRLDEAGASCNARERAALVRALRGRSATRGELGVERFPRARRPLGRSLLRARGPWCGHEGR